MNPTMNAVRLGLARGWAEHRQWLRSPEELAWTLLMAGGFVLVLFFQRSSTVEGIGQSLASVVLPSILGMLAGFSGVMGAAGILATEREDGTLLRAKAIPHGMVGYLVAKVTTTALGGLVSLVIVLVAGLFLVPELLSTSLAGWLSLVGLFALGLLATMPWGAIIGSLVRTPNAAFGLVFLPVGGLTAISGIFYPITALAGWVQAIAQLFPVYWLGLGMRAALLPEAAVAAELGQSWRHLETVGVLGAWAVAGLLLAPPVLRRMARRESGSAMEERRHRAMQRVG